MSDITVIVPIYNAEKRLSKCIKSILRQSYKKFELILINDGSNDNSRNICNYYGSKDSRIKLINQQNQGSIKARNCGIREATGKYIVFIDADDWIHKQMLEKLYMDIESNKSDISICKKVKVIGDLPIIKRDMNGNLQRFIEKSKIYNSNQIKDIVAKSFLFSGCFPCELFAKIYKRDLFENTGKYIENIKFFGDDLYLNIEVFLKARKISIIDEVLYYYRAGGGTSRYMPYYFDDIVNGYNTKKQIKNEIYNNNSSQIFTEINKNFLELFESCLLNIMYSGLTEVKIKQIMTTQINTPEIKEAVDYLLNNDYNNQFTKEIKDKDIDYLFNKYYYIKKKRKNKDRIINILSMI